MDFSFPKKERLKSKKLLERVFVEGRSINAFPLKLIYYEAPLNEVVSAQVAVIAPKKHFKRAVQRNKIKRLLRENYRLNKHLFFNNTERQYALVILYLGKEMPSNEGLSTKMKSLFEKFLKKISDEKTF